MTSGSTYLQSCVISIFAQPFNQDQDLGPDILKIREHDSSDYTVANHLVGIGGNIFLLVLRLAKIYRCWLPT